jgi:hypothetical protein
VVILAVALAHGRVQRGDDDPELVEPMQPVGLVLGERGRAVQLLDEGGPPYGVGSGMFGTCRHRVLDVHEH